MSADAWLTLIALVAMAGALVSGRVSPPAGIVGTAGALYVLQVTSAEEAFGGFARTAPVTVAGLYVIAAAIERTGALQPVTGVLLPAPGRQRNDLGRLVIPSAFASAFVANTPIVAMLVPAVTRWADRHGRSAAGLLIPLSYATILGGATTVIGTSTNLVVSGLLEDAGQEPLGLFELSRVGLPIAVVGVALIVVLAPVLLPERRSPRARDARREFTVSMTVEAGGAVDGRSVVDAGLRNLSGVYLAEIDRADRSIAPVRPDQTLRGGDRLVFAGRVDDVVDLHGVRGLTPAEATAAEVLADTDVDHAFFEVVIGASSPLVGRTVADADFRARYEAAVLAVHRSGEVVRSKIGVTRLRVGDALLVVSAAGFRSRWRDSSDFLLVSRLDAPPPPATRHAPLALAALIAVVALPAFGIMSVPRATILAVLGLVAVGVLRPREARDAVDLNVVAMIGGAFGLSEAVRVSGLADVLAGGLTTAVGWAGAAGAVVALVLATMVLTELITNAAAVALVFPIALDVADGAALDPRLLMIGVAVAASASFLTPVGYQTNTMVYGPGGYRFTDYLRLGLPLSALVVVGVTALVLMG
ncbi:MAG: SLC13 family permease [Actinomycetota bacterium]